MQKQSDSTMARAMKLMALIFTVLTALFAALRLEALAITAGTFAYHFLMRLGVGYAYDRTLHNRVDVSRGWFQPRGFENKLYERLRVGRWKRFLPTYDPETFDRHKHSWEEIVQAMCQAELVHETIAVLSFLPVVASVWLGEPLVFLLTSLLAAIFDMMFAVIQRYNRPRILKIVDRLKERA